MSGAVVVMRQNRAMRRFTAAGATTPELALRFEDLDIRPGWVIRRMVKRGVFVPVGDGRYYIDLEAADRFRVLRFRRMMIVLGICLLFWALIMLLVRR